MLLKLIIVDDEVFVRLGLKSTIDWSSIGYEIVGEAEDGQKALEVARETRPDVVLTDIFMPKLSGLELIKALKVEMPGTKIIVLSCTKDYEYVREAMQNWGAVDYLFKLSVQPEELIKVMKNIKTLIESERMTENKPNDVCASNHTMLPDIKIPEGSYISKALDYIDKFYSSQIKLKEVADHIHISENYLGSLFKKETGYHFTDFLNIYRIEKAREMLEKGNRTVNEVGESVGYSSLSYFSRVFKQQTGVNPIDYKKRSKPY